MLIPKRFIPFTIALSSTVLGVSKTGPNYHIVKSGDIFSEIANRHFGHPIYTTHGALDKLKILNPEIKHIDFIKPGQRIRLAEEYGQPLASETPTPVAKIHENKSDELFKKNSQIIINPGFRFVRIDTNYKSSSANALILSKSYFDLPILWQQNWSPSISSYQRFSLSSVQFDDPDLRTISNKNSMPIGFGIGARFFSNKKNRLITELGQDQFFFTRATSETALKLDTISIPNLKLKSEHDLINSNPFVLGVGLNLANYFSASHEAYKVKNGTGFGGGVYLSQKLKDSILMVKFNFDEISQNTSITDQKRVDLSGSIQYIIKNLD